MTERKEHDGPTAVGDIFEARLARAIRSRPVDTDILVRDALDELAQRRRWQRAAAAGLAALAVAVTLLVNAIMPAGEMVTRAGEWREVKLEDGTEVVLGPHSQVRREYSDDIRTVVLASGEAFFTVAKDGRPFQVEAESVIARATGTAFEVSRGDGAITVTVQEGQVSVAPRDRPAQALSVAAGEQVTVANGWPVIARRIDATRELAWVHKRLKFEAGDTLRTAVAEFNRRNALQIEIDPTLADRPVRGEFDANDPLSFAESAGMDADIVLSKSAEAVRLQVRQQTSGERDRGARDDR